MNLFAVSWNLNGEKPNYAISRERLINALDELCCYYPQGLESFCFLKTDLSIGDLSIMLLKLIDDDDRLFLSTLYPNKYSGQLDCLSKKWLSDNI